MHSLRLAPLTRLSPAPNCSGADYARGDETEGGAMSEHTGEHLWNCPPDPASPLESQVGGDHYKDMAIQPAEFITKNSLGFLEGCVIKRMCRWRKKNGVEDLRKAIHEIELLIELEGTS